MYVICVELSSKRPTPRNTKIFNVYIIRFRVIRYLHKITYLQTFSFMCNTYLFDITSLILYNFTVFISNIFTIMLIFNLARQQGIDRSICQLILYII